MKIAGIVKSSFIDYPGCASTVIFLGGCNFHCGYCHNPEIVTGGEGEIALPDFFAFLEKRKRFVDAVCVSGGEPTIHNELYDLIRKIKELGYKVKLDTNGTNPRLLGRLINEELLNHVAMDIKGPWQAYPRIAGYGYTAQSGDARAGRSKISAEHSELSCASCGSLNAAEQWECGDKLCLQTGLDPIVDNVKESFRILKEAGEQGGITYELRTTVCRELLDREAIAAVAAQLSGAAQWFLQTFKRQGELLDNEGSYSAYTPEEMEELRAAAEAVGGIGAVQTR